MSTKAKHIEQALRHALEVSQSTARVLEESRRSTQDLAPNTAARALEEQTRDTQDLTPGAVPQASVRRDLVMQIQELENTLEYMGETHPRRQSDTMRLRQLKVLLGRWDQTLQLQEQLPKLRRR